MASKICAVDLSFDHTWTISPNVCYRRGVPCVWFRRKTFLISGRIDHQQWQHVVAQLCASPTIHWTRNEECTGSGSGFLTGLNEYLMEIDVCLLMKKQFLFAANHRIHHIPLRLFFLSSILFQFKSRGKWWCFVNSWSGDGRGCSGNQQDNKKNLGTNATGT